VEINQTEERRRKPVEKKSKAKKLVEKPDEITEVPAEEDLPERLTPFCEECGGACCKDSNFLLLIPGEFERFYSLLEDKNLFSDQEKVIYFVNGRCPFLSDDNRCSCYEERPSLCRAWSCLIVGKGMEDFFEQNPEVLALIKKRAPKAWRKTMEAINGPEPTCEGGE
jgi:Fe-S-cluster containining protein